MQREINKIERLLGIHGKSLCTKILLPAVKRWMKRNNMKEVYFINGRSFGLLKNGKQVWPSEMRNIKEANKWIELSNVIGYTVGFDLPTTIKIYTSIIMSQNNSDKKETFTPGFWGWDSQWYEKIYSEVHGLGTVEVYSKFEQGGNIGEWIARVRGNTKQEAEANAAIMAASKDLYEALKAAYHTFSKFGFMWEGRETIEAQYLLSKMLAALNKANP